MTKTEYVSELAELQAKENKAHRTTVGFRNKIDKLKSDYLLPELRKEYEGKFFKYRNSAGGNDKWWIYCHCEKVINDREFVVTSFEVTPYQFEYKIYSKEFSHLFETEITKTEYQRAARNFLKSAQKIIK